MFTTHLLEHTYHKTSYFSYHVLRIIYCIIVHDLLYFHRPYIFLNLYFYTIKEFIICDCDNDGATH